MEALGDVEANSRQVWLPRPSQVIVHTALGPGLLLNRHCFGLEGHEGGPVFSVVVVVVVLAHPVGGAERQELVDLARHSGQQRDLALLAIGI